MVSLDDGDVHGLAEVVGPPAEGCQLLIGIQRIVNADLRPSLAQGADDAEDT